MVAKFVKEDEIENFGIGNVVFMRLLYVDDVILLVYFRRCTKAYEDIERVLHAYKVEC